MWISGLPAPVPEPVSVSGSGLLAHSLDVSCCKTGDEAGYEVLLPGTKGPCAHSPTQ